MVDSNDKKFGHFKQVVRGSNHDSCVWEESGWEERTHLECLTGSLTEISHC